MRRVPLLLALAAMPLFAIADSPPRAKMEMKLTPYDVKMRDYPFPSGLRIIFQEDHSQPIVSITSVYDRGSTSDPEGIEGVAHVCEHMWFRSQQKDVDGKPLPKVWDLLREMGANLNASTADDWTNYMTVAPKDKIIPLLRLESLRMKSAWEGIANEVLLTEREVVRNELRMRYENGFAAAFGFINVKLFPQTHPYGRAAYAGIGSHDSLNAITLPDVKKFFQDNYKPENVTIVVVGDFSLEDTPKFLEQFAVDQLVDPAHPNDELKLVEPKVRIKGPPTEPPPPVAPLEVKGELTGLTVERGAVEKPLLVLAWSLPSGYRDTDAELYIAANQLTTAIYQELVPSWSYSVKDSDITAVQCGGQPGKEGSFAFCMLEVKDEENARKVASKALDGLYRVWSADEFWRAYQQWAFSYNKMAWMAEIFQNVDLVSSIGNGRAAETANFVHYTGDPQYYSRQFEYLAKVDATRVRGLAEKYMNRNRAVGVLMLPYEEGDITTDTSEAQYRGARREDVLNTVLDEKTLTNDVIKNAVMPPDTSKIQEYILANGMKVVAARPSDAPLVDIVLEFDGGMESTPNGENYFAANMWRQESVVDELRIAGSAGFGMGEWTSSYQITASAGNVLDALYVLRDRIDNLKPYTSGRLDWVDGGKGDILDWMDEPDLWAGRMQMERLIPGHPTAHWYNHADWDRFNKWGTDVAAKAYAQVMRPENARLYVVGNVDPAAAKEAAQTYFGGWGGYGKVDPSAPKPAARPPVYPDPPSRQVLLFDKENTSQTQVSYSCQLGKLTPESVIAAQVMGDAISESTWLALREQTGASYGAYAGASVDDGWNGMLNMESLVQNDTAAMAVGTFLDLAQRAKDGKIPAKTVAIVKYDRAQKYAQGHQSTAQMMNRLRSTYRLYGGLDWFKRYPDVLSKVTASQFPALLERCVGHEVVTAVGPIDVIRPQFEKAGIPAEVFDWKQAKLDYATKYNLKDVLKAEEKKKKDEAAGKDKKK